jgi:hypothetical protein
VVERAISGHVDSRLKPGHDRERRSLRPVHLADGPVDVGPVEASVERDHLPVEPVQRPQPEVAVLGQLGEGEVAVVGALEQRPDRRSLKEHVRLPLGMQFRLPQRLHVQRPDPALVQHAPSLPGHSPRGCLT